MKYIPVIASGTLGLSTSQLVTILVVLLVISAIGIGILTVYEKYKKELRSMSGTLSKLMLIGLAARNRREILEEGPKSVSSMTKLFEPQIMRDFPEFSWEEFRTKAENMLVSALLAVSANDANRLTDASDEVKKQVINWIDDNRQKGISEVYSNIEIHQTEIANYQKINGKCVITIQSAVGYMFTKHQDGKLIAGNEKYKTQTKYNMELVYIQDKELTGEKSAVGTTCPQCGAPIKVLGAKYCEYCGSGVIPVNIRVWSLHKFYEVDYN